MLELLRREERGAEEASVTFTSSASMNTNCVLANDEAPNWRRPTLWASPSWMKPPS
jgi:hypothetical protein